ncbi:MAG: phosphoethanolamine--lipid A transferase [Hydrogenophaga sp.]|nr:phosphoethanolamine--lipid A transferase [Hydrogenophaga sp.]
MQLESHQPAGWHPTVLLSLLALWLATLGNVPLWLKLAQVSALQQPTQWVMFFGWGLFLWSAILAFTGFWIWPRWRKPAGLLLLLTGALSSHFMYSYSVVIDPTMWANVVNTDVREARDLLSGPLGWVLLMGFALPGWWWWRRAVRPVPRGRLVVQQVATVFGCLVLAVGVLWLGYQDMASLMRNHKSLRYMINPFNTVYAATRHNLGRASHAQQPLRRLAEDAVLQAGAASGGEAPLVLIVVGETARAANVGLGGYARDTTPRLQQLMKRGDMVYFDQASSCGTNTQTSVPCMFSAQTRLQYDPDLRQENLLDVLQRAGLAVLWLDNQSGCKGVCERVTHSSAAKLLGPERCPDGECPDGALLEALPAGLALLDPARRARGTVVVLHQMGSHGPAYYRRTPPGFKVFGPECQNTALTACRPEEIVNAYDNTIRYTDHVLAEAVAWLERQPQPAVLYYVSDHGESLGEKGLYLHGMPYGMAPKEQTHVPMLMWWSPAYRAHHRLDLPCLRQQASQPVSHDHLFHSVLGLAAVQTRTYLAALDVAAPCRGELLGFRGANPGAS